MMKSTRSLTIALFALFAITAGIAITPAAHPQTAVTASVNTNEKPYSVEWVYRVKYGYKDEWWTLFQKYQITVLDKEKELGYVKSYIVYAPGLHTSNDSRWDYRIEITYKDQGSAGHGGEVSKQLFPDQQATRKEENRRWELTENHWDLPIHPVDPHQSQ